MEISQIDFVFLLLYSLGNGAVLGIFYNGIKILRALIVPQGIKCSRDYSDVELPIIHKKV